MSSAKVMKRLKLGLCGSASFDKLSESKMDDTEEKLPYIMDYLTPSMVEEAKLQLRETEEVKIKALEDFRALIRKEKNFVIPMDDAFLLQYLRARKFNVKRAFKLLQNYWIFRRDHRKIFDSSNSDIVIQLILRNYIGFLPYRDRQGCVVAIFKVGLWNPDSDNLEQLFRAIAAILIHSIQFPASQVCGYRMIFDARGLSWSQMKMCTPANILLLIHSTQHCFPARYKGFHILSENKLFNLAWSIIYPLLTSKLKRRVMLHGSDLSALLDYISPSVLPLEYGGEAESLDNIIYKDVIKENTEKVLDQLNYGYKD
ncbi:alpha-tocopherol transfer protein-like [Parasteatoda tepidariorum]|uniref:alpha-tocopherol transfer protein-like n=1 Tax=Parasteatoda tepidariorum TaxID=114398 RepID=UPI00077FCF72|nr:alpha-tocopherol transfer protein-like [Parasteatoda tepidariorum]XP_015926985.1 alpha-tocopherol transfer protein-like [Parasteatoda tepidariorum]XP_015926993.1 alpha-tocopherol transfer protein-like [Parasteatoda tepidariorum]XP_015927002.1 alpha-tocopherol transfer protein-like [Parasteatoda tepidariorum]XP_042908530.1 alpha-tocopherol transfer protein-like [Parasteatoda tepidariorum]XP_042908531.1 alpha-tocopherol transfer protein-like [Parasteatoda tepidariorum]